MIRRLDACVRCKCGLLAPAHHNDLMDDHHDFEQWPWRTAETVTDDEIRELRAALLRESDMQLTNDTDACGMALRDPDSYPVRLQDAARAIREISRERCAELINERAIAERSS